MMDLNNQQGVVFYSSIFPKKRKRGMIWRIQNLQNLRSRGQDKISKTEREINREIRNCIPLKGKLKKKKTWRKGKNFTLFILLGLTRPSKQGSLKKIKRREKNPG
jgi:hypothetical protein